MSAGWLPDSLYLVKVKITLDSPALLHLEYPHPRNNKTSQQTCKQPRKNEEKEAERSWVKDTSFFFLQDSKAIPPHAPIVRTGTLKTKNGLARRCPAAHTHEGRVGAWLPDKGRGRLPVRKSTERPAKNAAGTG